MKTLEKLKCDNCGYTDYAAAFGEAKDVLGRHQMTDMFSDRECPLCGALGFPLEPKPEEAHPVYFSDVTVEGGYAWGRNGGFTPNQILVQRFQHEEIGACSEFEINVVSKRIGRRPAITIRMSIKDARLLAKAITNVTRKEKPRA